MNKWLQSTPLKFDGMLLVFRMVVGLGMAFGHGLPKFQKLVAGGEIKFYSFLGMGPEISLVLAVGAEFFASLLLVLGLWTRLSLIPLIITMAVAVFLVHGGDPFSKMETALLYLGAYVLLLVMGPGRFSLDHLISSRKR